MVEFMLYTRKSKVRCPQCGKDKRLTRYINAKTGDPYPSEFGKCDREIKCGYHNRPTKEGAKKIDFVPLPPKPVDFLTFSDVEKREANNGVNHFFTFLESIVGREGFLNLKSQYRLGTSLKYSGFVSFPQLDLQGRVCRIKEMAYDPETGKRSKSDGSQRWAFEAWEFPDLNLKQCYFGLHLLDGNTKPIGVVESEKTALICSHFLKDFVWIATGSLGMLNNERCKPLKGRNLTLFPDVGEAFQKWQRKAKYIKGTASIKVSDYLEGKELKEGQDLADLLIENLQP